MSKFIFISAFLLCLFSVCFAQIGNNADGGIANDKALSADEIAFINAANAARKTIRNSRNARLSILSKPRAVYTDQAKTNKIEGIVILQITFKKNGEIGKINVINGLSDGLNEQAIAAAKKIKFTPQRKNGKSITVTKKVKYNFTIY